MTDTKTIPLDQVLIDGNPVDLEKEISLVVSYNEKDRHYIVENDELNIFAIHQDLDVAIIDIQEQVGMLCTGYVREDPDALTEDAKKLRNLLISFIVNPRQEAVP